MILLCFHADQHSQPLYLKAEGLGHSIPSKGLRSRDLFTATFLIVHAVAGCDITSRLFGIGKKVPLRKIKSDEHFRKQAEMFSVVATTEEIHTPGEETVTCLYGGHPGEGLDELRHRLFCEKVSKSTAAVQVHTLPPASAAARYHSARVYYQVLEWINPDENLDPLEWGWTQMNEKLEPCKADLPAAPESLLKVTETAKQTVVHVDARVER